MMSKTMTFRVGLDAVEQVLAVIEDTTASNSGSSQELFEISTCCREALNNIVEHSGQSWFSTRIRIVSAAGHPVFVVSFSHDGFVPRPNPANSMPLDTLSGRGWPIMEAWMDRVRHRCVNGSTRLTLIRRLSGDPPAQAHSTKL